MGKDEAPERLTLESGSEQEEGNDGHMFDETGGVGKAGGGGGVLACGRQENTLMKTGKNAIMTTNSKYTMG